MGSDMTLPLPMTAEEVTLGWLQAILKDKTIASFEITQKRLFETASKLYIILTYEDPAVAKAAEKPTYILLKGGFNADMFAIPGFKDLLMCPFTEEVDFFLYFAPTLPPNSGLQLPKVWWAGATKDNAILAMEDLSQAGYKFGNATRTYSVNAVRRGLDQLAVLHASTWGWTYEEHAWVNKGVYDDTIRLLMTTWDEVVGKPGRPSLPSIIGENHKGVARALEGYFTTRNPRFRCLVHGDPHSANTFMSIKDEEQTRFLDWQLVHIGSSVHDVAYFLVSMLTVADRRKHEWELVEGYLKTLAASGGPTISVDDPELRIEYRKAQIPGIGWVLTPYSMQKSESVNAMVERYAAAIVDHKSIELLTEENPEA